MTVLGKMAAACTGKVWQTGERPKNIKDIPVTTTGDGVYVIELRGGFGNFEFKNERLMGVKGTNYFVAILRGGEWHEVAESQKPIEGAMRFNFEGSYTEYSRQGLRNMTMKVGFGSLMWSLISLCKGRNSCPDFLTVCVNMFEPARYPIMGREIMEYPFGCCTLSESFLELIYEWKKLSEKVIVCQGDEKTDFEFNIIKMTVKVYGDGGVLEKLTVTKINKGNVYKLLGMVKCDT